MSRVVHLHDHETARRTRIEARVPPSLARRAKIAAARKGQSISELIASAVRAAVANELAPAGLASSSGDEVERGPDGCGGDEVTRG